MKPLQTFRRDAASLMSLALPLMASNVAQFLLPLTDQAMIGWYDVTALAALTLAGGIAFILSIVGRGFAIAVAPMVSAAEEAGDPRESRRVTRMGFWLTFGFFLLTWPLFWWSKEILSAIGQEPVIAEKAGAYLRIAYVAMLPMLLTLCLRSFLSALELAGIVLWSALGSAVVNVALNWLFIFGNLGMPELGIQGAAIATVGSAFAALAVQVIYVRRRLPERALFDRFWVSDWEALFRVFRLGLPIGMTLLAEGGMFVIASVMAGWIGTVALATHGIALLLCSVIFMVHLGISEAATVRTGRALKRADKPGLIREAVVAAGLAGLVIVLTVVLFIGKPVWMMGLFVAPDDPDRGAILALGTHLLAIGALFQLADAAQVMLLAHLRGFQDTRVPMLMAVVSYWGVGLLVAFVFGPTEQLGGPGAWLAQVLGQTPDFGVLGLWLGLTAGLLVASVLLFWRLLGCLRLMQHVPAAAPAD